MSLFRIVVWVLFATTALAQPDDISHRLRNVLASAESGDLACTALANHDFARVKQMLARLRPTTSTETSEILALTGAIEFLDGKMNPAAADFQKASQLSLLKDADAFTYAMTLVNLGDDSHARALLTTLAEKYPSRAIYVYWLGRLDYSQRRYVEAVEKLKRASDLDSQSARIWDSLGLAFDMQGRMNDAADAFRKAANLNRVLAHPSPWPPHDLGFLLLRMDQPKEAESLLREALHYDPDLSQAHYHLGRALEREGRETQAIEEYRTAASDDMSSADACYSLAMLYRKLHRDTEASAMFAEYKARRQETAEKTMSTSQ